MKIGNVEIDLEKIVAIGDLQRDFPFANLPILAEMIPYPIMARFNFWDKNDWKTYHEAKSSDELENKWFAEILSLTDEFKKNWKEHKNIL